MSTQEKKSFWSNPWTIGIGTTVLATFILKLIDVIADTTILSSIWHGIKLFSNLNIKVWWVLILLVALFLIGLILSRIPVKESIQEQRWLQFTQMKYKDILVKWNYQKLYGNNYEINGYKFCCPKDGCELHYDRCPVCHAYYSAGNIDISEVQKVILHKIDTEYKS